MGWMFDFGTPRKMPYPTASECDIPLWALGRDLNSAMEVETVSVATVKDVHYSEPQLIEKARVKVLSNLKSSRYLEGMNLDVIPFAGEEFDFRYNPPERMKPRRRYLLLWQDEGDDPPLPGISLERCGVQPDTPEVRKELEKGIAMNDGYRDHWPD